MAATDPSAGPRPPKSLERDGTSQTGRTVAALNPEYVAVDERGPEDDIRFVRELCERLTYYGPDGNAQGDFSGFLDGSLASEDLVAFLREPEGFSPQRTPGLFRPHRVLFLVFLKLVEKWRKEVNQLTARHLDFYYRQILQMSRKPAQPDRVNVLVDLRPSSTAALLPRGALLDAGVDSQGKPRAYATERDLVVGRAQIARVSSLFADRSHSQPQAQPQTEPGAFRNFYAAADATTVARPRDGQGGEEATRWTLFGVARPSAEEGAPPPVMGWALSSPLLLLSEGQRDITLTLFFRATAASIAGLFAQKDALPLRFEISTSKGFVACEAVTCAADADAAARYRDRLLHNAAAGTKVEALRFSFSLSPSVAAIEAPPREMLGIDSPWPVLRLMLQPRWDASCRQHVVPYPQLAQRVLVAAALCVSVRGLGSLELANDDANLDSTKPFEPFTAHPVVGSQLRIGHRELVCKPLSGLALNLQWMGAPADLVEHYAAYGAISRIDETGGDPRPNLAVRISLVDRAQREVLAARAPLFAAPAGDAPDRATLELARLPDRVRSLAPAAPTESWLEQSLSHWHRYLQLELLAPDFQHGAYPALAARRALQLATDIANGSARPAQTEPLTPAHYALNPPYTPRLKSLTVDYSASVELRLDVAPDASSVHRTFHIHPFGACDSEAERTQEGLPLLPQYPNEGELYIGLKDVAAPQTVSLFFQMLEGSGNPDKQAAPVRWSYLSKNRWLPLDERVLSDTTRGLSNTGIVELALPAAEPSTRHGGGLYFLRAGLAAGTDALCDCCGLHTQAVTAVFVDRGNDPAHFREPLPKGTITKLLSAPAAVAGVRQPYTSSGGRSAEDDRTWATRVSERLRHKQRALSPWDYERIVLARFPELYKVKCIPADQDSPSEVRLVVVPDIRSRLPFQPLEPKAPRSLLAEVREYVSAHAPAFAKVTVQNAHYTAVCVRLGVRFRELGNEEYYKSKLSEELCRFLCPWAYEEGVDIVIGGRIYASSIVNFVERRPYVDYVAGIRFFCGEEEGSLRPVLRTSPGGVDDDGVEGYYVGPSRPDAVLRTAKTHVIDVLSDDLYDERLRSGVDFMKLGFDLIVAAD